MISQDITKKIAFVGNYLPRQCGIATFCHDLRLAVATQYPSTECFVVAVNDGHSVCDYSEEVYFEMQEQEISDYHQAADFLNFNNIDVLCLQHEFGIYGGPAGSHILTLLRHLRVPVVTTLHTILPEPNRDQQRVMDELITRSTRIVVMTERSKALLAERYQVIADKMDIIPHGVPDMPFVEPNGYKAQLGINGKYVLLTYGLLSSNKGIEYALEALPRIVAKFPNLVYCIVGATHPNIVREYGESYRARLKQIVRTLGIENHVLFYDKFVELDALKKFIAAADIVITPYPDVTQSTSGTLSYSFGAGKTIISTPYLHAQEMLAKGRGVFVPFRDSDAIASAAVALLKDEQRRYAIGKMAYLHSREMVWSNVAHLYVDSFRKARAMHWIRTIDLSAVESSEKQHEHDRQLPAIRLSHLARMSDSMGMLQHARFAVPNFEHGYCTDDNARALLLTICLEEIGQDSEQLRSLSRSYAAFINYAFNPEKKRFRNFMNIDRRWLEEVGSEESHGRALWALGTLVGRSKQPGMQNWASQLFDQALPLLAELTSPRAWCFGLLGIHEYWRRFSGHRATHHIRRVITQRLVELFRQNASDGWLWFEDMLFYDNAKLPHALILSKYWMKDQDAFDIGLRSLAWLVEVQTAESGHFRPVGNNGWYTRGSTRAQFDQQPIEAHATVSACLEAFRATQDLWWLGKARVAFEWFLGRNDLGLKVYNPDTGSSYDGLQPDRLNLNQGAESTLAFLLSLVEMYSLGSSLGP
jgi:glycosyltransferase involved in cell wall biosynthesis